MSVRSPRRPDVETAAFRLGGAIRRTPVITLDPAETGLDATTVLKLELTQHSGSFKSRGALNNVLSLEPGVTGVCAASGGNHAGAVSWAGQRAGVTADVFVPRSATPAKIARIAEYGGRAHLVDGQVREALDACRDFADANQVPVIHPYDTFETVCGAGTLGLELEDQAPEADLVVVACGGGGLFAGLCAAFDGVATVQPVEPRLCPALFDALRAGIRVPTTVGGVAADSLGAPMIGELGYEAAVENEVGSVLVDEDAILAARRFLWSRLRILAEPGACVALAAVLAGAVDVSPGQTVAVVVSGGNDDSLPA